MRRRPSFSARRATSFASRRCSALQPAWRSTKPEALAALAIGRADVDIVALDAHLVGAEVGHGRTRQALAGGDLELCCVQRAFDGAALDEAFRQGRELVGAGIVDRVDLPADAIERDRRAVEVGGESFAVAHVDDRSEPMPGAHATTPGYSAATPGATATCSS